jgi:hypothetical protein
MRAGAKALDRSATPLKVPLESQNTIILVLLIHLLLSIECTMWLLDRGTKMRLYLVGAVWLASILNHLQTNDWGLSWCLAKGCWTGHSSVTLTETAPCALYMA